VIQSNPEAKQNLLASAKHHAAHCRFCTSSSRLTSRLETSSHPAVTGGVIHSKVVYMLKNLIGEKWFTVVSAIVAALSTLYVSLRGVFGWPEIPEFVPVALTLLGITGAAAGKGLAPAGSVKSDADRNRL
jgi:hypothetical protein